MPALLKASGSSVVLRGAEIYGDESSGLVDIAVRNGRIEAIARVSTLVADHVEEMHGMRVMPGVIDAHTHPIHDETFESIGRVAASGGVTTTLHHLYPEPGESYLAAVERATKLSGLASADFGFHLRVTPDRAREPLNILDHLHSVVSVKVFLAHTDPSVRGSLSTLYTVMSQAKAARVPVIVHAEFGDVLEEHENTVGAFNSLEEFQAGRPDYLEAAAVHAVAGIAELTGARTYIAHVSNVKALAAARSAKDRGVHIAVETCPHYFFLDATANLGGLGKVSPPLRMPDEVQRMRSAMRDGYVDVMASDHCGYGRHEKFADNVSGSGNGLPGIETMLPLLLEAAAPGGWLTPRQVLALLCEGPALAFGLEGKGRLQVGYDADLVFFDPGSTWQIEGPAMNDASFYSPYSGYTMRNRVERVYRRGELVFTRGPRIKPSSGRPIRRVSTEGLERGAQS